MHVTHLTRRLLWVAGLVLAGALPGQAGDCGYEYCWGAVAVGPDGAASRSSGLRTAPRAWDRAEIACGGKCTTIETFSNGCGAIAVDKDEVAWAGFAESRGDAEAEAMDNCAQSDARLCRIRVWACSK